MRYLVSIIAVGVMGLGNCRIVWIREKVDGSE